MAATVHQLHQPSSIGGFIRVGHTGQRKLGDLHAAGRLGFRRFVFDAAHIDRQVDLLKTLKASGCEIVLDPNFAEMAAAGKYEGSVARLPWANTDAPWSASDFGRGSNLNPARLIAEFAVKYGVDVVMAPSHLIEAHHDAWWTVDRTLCTALRFELDRNGGTGIAIDHQVITTNGLLRDEAARAQIVAAVAELPVQNVWLRISGFGATATGAGTRSYIEALRELHAVGRPLIADAVGGFSGLAVAAFGAVSGISHGVCQRESFDVSYWKRPRTGQGGGSETRIYVPDLDRYFSESQMDVIFRARGGKGLFGCTDTDCCARPEDQIGHAQDHMLTRRSRQLDELSHIPELRRPEHFLLKLMHPAVTGARKCAGVKLADEKVAKAVVDAKGRLVRLREALGDLQAKDLMPTHSRKLTFRGGGNAISAVIGR